MGKRVKPGTRDIYYGRAKCAGEGWSSLCVCLRVRVCVFKRVIRGLRVKGKRWLCFVLGTCALCLQGDRTRSSCCFIYLLLIMLVSLLRRSMRW